MPVSPSALPDIDQAPHALFAHLRRHAPVTRLPGVSGQPEWFVTRYGHVEQLLKDRSLLSNHPPGPSPLLGRGALRGQPTLDDLFNRNLLYLDPPDHTRLRALVTPAFGRQQTDALAAGIADDAERLLDELAGQSRCELIEDYAYRLPLLTIARLLGVGDVAHADLRDWADALVAQNARTPDRPALYHRLHGFARYLLTRFQACDTTPDDSLICQLVAAREDGDRLNLEELFNMVALLIVAGFETVANLIGNGTLGLLQHPEQRACFIDRPDLGDAAIEELLRYDGPIKTSSERWAAQDFELNGQRIRQGDPVRLVFASANRDEAVFDAPDALRLDRAPVRNYAFGSGIHYCVGTRLARLQGRIALQALFTRFPNLALGSAPEALRWHSNLLIRALTALPLRLS